MRKRTLLVSLLTVLALILTACAVDTEDGGQAPDGTPATVEETQLSGTAVTLEDENPQAAEIIPPTGRPSVSHLSNLLDFQVLDNQGTNLGTVDDYVLNMCEAHIIYIVLEAGGTTAVEGDNPAQEAGEPLNLQAGSRMLIPYEVVTLGGGALDVDQQAIVLNVEASQISNAPTFDQVDLTTTDWETDVRAYWSEIVNLSGLTTACTVSRPQTSAGADATGTPAAGDEPEQQEQGPVEVTKIDYASQILGMQLQDANGNVFGQIEEVFLVPGTGRLQYVAVNLDESFESAQGIVLVPIGAVNLQSVETDGETQTVLVLLVEREVLANAPASTAMPDPANSDWDGPAFEYWSQHVPMTQEDLP